MTKALIGIAVIALLGGGYLVYTGQLSIPGTSTGEGTESARDERLMEGATASDPNSLPDGHAEGETSTGTWGELLGMGSFKCDVGSVTNGVESVGVAYVANGNMRGDFTSTVDGKVIDSHLIVAADTVYMWSSAMPGMGFKAPKGAAAGEGSAQATFDANQEVNYSCAPWSADSTMFQPPSTVTFTDIQAMMKAGMPQ